MSAVVGNDKTGIIRDAGPDDVAAVQAIYAHHVLTGTASFEETPPDDAEITRRMTSAQEQGFPFLVAEKNGTVVAYAYASPFRARPAYRYTTETSVYVEKDAGGHGIGHALMIELIARCEAIGLRRMIAVIGDSGNAASIALHRKVGFNMVGAVPGSGFKLGRWVDTVYMERPLGEGSTTLPAEKNIETGH